jgi:hypothetical protein
VRATGPSENHFVNVAPHPIFAGLDRLHQRMLGGVKMLGGVLVLGGIATAYVAALQAYAQVHPIIPDLETLLAALGARFRSRTLFQVMAMLHVPLICKYSEAGA